MQNIAHRMFVIAATLFVAAIAYAQQAFDLDPSFRTAITQQYVSSVLPVEEGKLIVSGKFILPQVSPFYPVYLARFFSDGTLDDSFYPSPYGGGGISAWQDRFYLGNGLVSRVLTNGELDPTFSNLNLDTLFLSGSSLDYHVFPDGRVLLAGSHSVLDSAHGFYGTYRLVWFTNTGRLDTARVHRRANGAIWYIDEMPDSKFMCSGTFNTYEDISVPHIIRIHADGVLDSTFNADITNWGIAYKFIPLADGSILAGGYFKQTNTTDTLCLMRFLPNGDLDPSYHRLHFKQSSSVTTLAYATDILQVAPDRFVITGDFDSVDGETRGGIVLVDENGNMLDEAFAGEGCGVFNYQPQFQGPIYPARALIGITPTPNGNYYIYGSYHGYDDGTTNDPLQRFVSRLYGLSVGVAEHQKLNLNLYPNPATTAVTLHLEKVPTNANVVMRDALGREVFQQRITDHYTSLSVNDFSPGLYLFEIWSNGNRVGSERLVVE